MAQPVRSAARPAMSAPMPDPAPTPADGVAEPWLWVALAAVLLVFVRSLGAPLGEPVADDFDDLGLILFSVVAWRLADAGRLAPALLALLAALLCKETAVATGLMLPWLAHIPPGGSRRRWMVWSGVVTAAWAVAYLLVRQNLALVLPHGLEAQLSPHLFLEPER